MVKTLAVPECWVIVAAGGMGLRFGADVPKQFVPIDGNILVSRTLRALLAYPGVKGVVIVVPAGYMDAQWVPQDLRSRADIRLVEGGKERTDSVAAGLAVVPSDCQLILIHDGVRPCCTAELIERVAEVSWREGACVPVVPANETIKEVGEGRQVIRTLPREQLRVAQTPQGFRRDVLERAYRFRAEHGGGACTDDAALVEASGQPVVTVMGEHQNIKVTRPDDLMRLGFCLPRVGFGYDVHRLVPGRALILGGVPIPFEVGLLGHSDADVVLHALCDAILGAAALGDIGQRFPDTDPRYRGISSLTLLADVVAHVAAHGYSVASVDLTVVAQKPRLAEYLPAMARAIAPVLMVPHEAIGIKATTEEGLGFTGSQQGIAAYAVAVLRPSVISDGGKGRV
jgi:2-C-methyl-D-erythritol 4-phosphate cytidylyltransferase/2-C-methyl-D-erythritol 2,4-cyclodiphosphate synthase